VGDKTLEFGGIGLSLRGPKRTGAPLGTPVAFMKKIKQTSSGVKIPLRRYFLLRHPSLDHRVPGPPSTETVGATSGFPARSLTF
jgi:hypothetical protein